MAKGEERREEGGETESVRSGGKKEGSNKERGSRWQIDSLFLAWGVMAVQRKSEARDEIRVESLRRWRRPVGTTIGEEMIPSKRGKKGMSGRGNEDRGA